MRVNKLKLENFKKFSTQQFSFDQRFTLLVGVNGAGKTSILDGLAVAMGVWLVRPPDSAVANSRRNILPSEVRLEARQEGDRIQFREIHPTRVEATGTLHEVDNVTWVRERLTGSKGETVNKNAKQALQIIEALYEKDRAGQKVICPVLAYYGAGRAWLPSNQRIRSSKEGGPAKRWAAFYDCFNERIRFGELTRWFARETTQRGNRQGRWRPGFKIVLRAVLRCVPDATDVWFDADLDQIVLAIGNLVQPFENLSAGQKMMFALVADLAIKVVTQNAFLLPPDEAEDQEWPQVLLKTPGVVLIDELDIHLHPIWQRTIAKDLKEAFPAIQFVCTSHSPQLIGELQPEEILLLHDDTVSHPAQSFGMDSNWVVEVLMGGAKCNKEVQSKLVHLFSLIQQKRITAAEDEAFRLRGEIGNSEDLQRAVSIIERLRVLGK